LFIDTALAIHRATKSVRRTWLLTLIFVV
jgi:hypothetical protein